MKRIIIITTFFCAVAATLGAQMSTVMSQMQQQGRALTASAVWGEIIGLVTDQDDLMDLFDDKQDVLVSGTNIKTINSSSIVGSGNLSVSASVSDGDKTGVQVSGSGATWTVKKVGFTYDVTQYGLVADGSTDNSSAMNTLVAAVAANSTLYFPVGDYKFVTSIVIPKTVNIQGESPYSRLITAADIVLLDFDAGGTTPVSQLILDNFSIVNTKGSTPSSVSIGLRGEYAFQWHVTRVGVYGFYKNIQVINVIDDVWDDITCIGWVHTAMEHRNASPYVDNGDGSIDNSRFISNTYNSEYGIYHENGGGLKITNTKFNALSNKMKYQYYYDANGTTVDILILNNSFENFSEGAIRIGETSGNIREVAITGNDIGATSTSGVEGITLIGVDIVTIGNNIMKGGSGSSTAISITNGDNITECGNTFDSWTTTVTNSGATNFRQCQY